MVIKCRKNGEYIPIPDFDRDLDTIEEEYSGYNAIRTFIDVNTDEDKKEFIHYLLVDSNKKGLKTLEEMMKIYADICKDLSEKLDKYKREVKNDRNNASGKVVSPIPGGLKVEELEEKFRKYINN